MASLKGSKEHLDDSTLEKLLNGEETDLLLNHQRSKEKEERDEDYIHEEFHVDSDELK